MAQHVSTFEDEAACAFACDRSYPASRTILRIGWALTLLPTGLALAAPSTASTTGAQASSASPTSLVDAALQTASALLEATKSTEFGLGFAAGFIAFVASALMVRSILRRRRERASKQPPSGAKPGRFEASPIALLGFDAAGLITHYNREAAQLLRLPAVFNADEPRTWAMVFGPGTYDEMRRSVEAAERAEIEIPVGAGDTRRWLCVRIAKDGDSIEACVEDVTVRKDADRQLRHLAHHDPLTGLLNRRGFDVRREAALRAVHEGQSLMLAYLDLDRFKLVNDMYGHTAGDHVLRQVADRLRAHVKSPHALARVGGDEFVMLLIGVTASEAQSICDAALDSLRRSPYRVDDKAFSVDGSIGLTRIDGHRLEQDIVVACDRACSEAKRAGGGRVIMIDEGSAAALEQRDEARLVATFSSSNPESSLFVQFQPIVSLHHPTQSLSYEVLLRMRDERGGTVPPARFINAAERNGLTSRLDRHVLTRTLAWLDEHPEHRDQVSFVALNISRASLNDDRFIADVSSIMREHPATTERLCFEITESAALGDVAGTRRFVDVIKRFGARLALDDFGAEYTSFSHLKDLQSDFVKIDTALIRDINSNPANFSVVRAIADVSHDLGMACVGEWAETDGIIRALLELNVDYAQGFALSQPLDPEELLKARDCGSLVADPLIAALLAVDRTTSSAPLALSRRNPLGR